MSARGNRRRGSAELIVIRWRDIPAQVTASADGVKETRVLDDRFQQAIDRAAAVAGLTQTQAYVGEWRRETRPLAGPPAEAVTEVANGLEAAYDRSRLEDLVQAGGLDAPTADRDTPHDP